MKSEFAFSLIYPVLTVLSSKSLSMGATLVRQTRQSYFVIMYNL